MRVLIADPASQKAIDYLLTNGFKVTVAPKIKASQLLSQIAKFAVLLVRSRTKVDKEVIENGKNLKVIGRIGSGYDNIDLEAASTAGIKVINAPEANSQSVAELTVGLMIILSRKLDLAFSSMRDELWLKNEIWGSELAGKNIGIVGYGHVGKRVVNILKGYDCKIHIYSKSRKTSSLEDLFTQSDIISLHLSLNKETEGLIGGKLLAKMKKNAFLINLSRGKIIDEEALFNVIKNKRIAGAALDVFWEEPLPVASKWRKLENVILTPHIGAATYEALSRASLTVAKDLVRIAKGEKPKFRVI